MSVAADTMVREVLETFLTQHSGHDVFAASTG